ncbi:MAG: oligosaccharide flippase family protein [Lachnospiraceae bacterium]|nr:oligosaccharide flippase family protein [Lachnospiraceae bacterium]
MSGDDKTAGLKKGLIYVFIANALTLVLSLLTGFVLPKVLSVPTYARIKDFSLYTSYIGVLHLGYLDGLYLTYGGKKLTDISHREMSICRTNIFLLQTLMTVGFAVAGILMKEPLVFIFSLCLIPENVATLYKNLYQATGEFGRYSSILNLKSVMTLISYVVLLFIVKTDNYIPYVLVYLFLMLIMWIGLEREIRGRFGFKLQFKASFQNLKENISSGMVLMLGNFSSTLMTSLDRWFVKALLLTEDFAYYSFAVSMESLINTFVIPVTTTLYNFLCQVTDVVRIKKIKTICLIFSLYMVSSAFPVKFILEHFLTKYQASTTVMFILFSTQILYMIIKGVYINVYKARKQQGMYLKQLMIVIALGAVFNTLFYLWMGNNEGIALGTLCSVICWYLICMKSVPELNASFAENLLMALGIVVFLFCGFFLNSIVGFAVYIIVITLLCLVLDRAAFVETIRMGKDMVLSKLKKQK